MTFRSRVRPVLLAVAVVGTLAACSSDGLDPSTPAGGNDDENLPPATDTRTSQASLPSIPDSPSDSVVGSQP